VSDLKSKLENYIISNLNSLRYDLTEPLMLWLARSKYEKDYSSGKNEPFITVYVPTYNRGKILIERAMPSVLAQTYKNFELIIIGDHCTDDTKELVSKFDDPLEKLLRLAQENNFEFVSGQYMGLRDGKKTVCRGVRAASYYSRKKMQGNDTSPLMGGTSTWLYRSYLTFMKYNINCWRKSWNRVNDADFGNRVYRAGVRMGFLPEVLSYVLPRPGENQVGLGAYLSKAKEKKEHYKFDA